MAVLLALVRLATLLSNIWATYKVLKPAPRSRGRESPSARAVATRKRELKACLAVWIVWITWTCAERIADNTVGILIPFYSDLKTVFLAILYFTRAMIAEPLLLHFIRPTIKPYISTIDTFLELFHIIGEVLIYYASAPWRYLNGSSEGDIVEPDPSPTSDAVPAGALAPPPRGDFPATTTPVGERRDNIRSQVDKPSNVPAIHSEPPKIQIGTRTRRGMEATGEILSPEAFKFPSIVPPKDVDAGSSSVNEEFIVQTAFIPHLLPPPPLPKPMTPAKTPVAKHFPSSVVHPSPRFPGGFALSSTETQSETEGQTSATAVQSAVNPTPNSQFSFPEPPPIEMFAPGSFQSSELPRSRLRTITPRTSQAFTTPAPQLVAEPEPRPTARQAVNRLLASIPSASASIAAESKRGSRAVGAPTQQSVAEAAHAPVPAPHKLLSTYPVSEPVPAAPQPTLKRKLTLGEESKHPVSSATLARRERIASASGVTMPAPGGAKGANSRSRARKASAADTSSASTSTSGSTSSTNSRRAAGVAAGKKRSARGNIVESPRVPSAASEIDDSDKASTTGSSKKKRRVEDPVAAQPVPEAKGKETEKGREKEKQPVSSSAPAAQAKPNPPAATVAQVRPNDSVVDRYTAQAAFGRTAPPVARRRDDYSLDAAFSEAAFGRASSTAPSTSQNGKNKSPPKVPTGMNETLDDSSDDDDESWSALDEFKTPRHATRTLRSRTVFSDDSNPPPPLPQPKPSLAPLKIPPQAPALSAVKSDSTTMFSAISDLVEVDAHAAIGAVRGGGRGGKEDTGTIRSNAPPIRVSRNAAAAARGIRLRAGARGL